MKKKEQKYRIVGKTNGWIANRDIEFNGKCRIVIERGLTLKEAQKKLLDMFNGDYEEKISFPYTNWGMARCHHQLLTWSHKDGRRGYEYDSRYYSIEEEETED